MRCGRAQRRLEAYLGGELTAKERVLLDRHLASCAGCSQAVEHARQLRKTLGQQVTPPLLEGFHARLMARAREHAEGRRWTARILRPFGWTRAVPVGRRAALAASVVLALGIGILIGRDLGHAAPLHEEQAAQEEADADPVRIYRVDYLAEAPEGSMAEAYVSLISAGQGG